MAAKKATEIDTTTATTTPKRVLVFATGKPGQRIGALKRYFPTDKPTELQVREYDEREQAIVAASDPALSKGPYFEIKLPVISPEDLERLRHHWMARLNRLGIQPLRIVEVA